jgi:hypothetical protein
MSFIEGGRYNILAIKMLLISENREGAKGRLGIDYIQ